MLKEDFHRQPSGLHLVIHPATFKCVSCSNNILSSLGHLWFPNLRIKSTSYAIYFTDQKSEKKTLDQEECVLFDAECQYILMILHKT